MNESIQKALATQHDGHGDSRPAPSGAEIKQFINTNFPDARNEVCREFSEACESLCTLAVIDKLSRFAVKMGASGLLKEYFGGHIREYQSQEPRGKLGSKSMSFFLQSKPDQEMICRNFSHSDFFSGLSEYVPVADREFEMVTPSLHMASASFPSGWQKKDLTVGDTETEGQESLVADAFNSCVGLEILLLLNRLYNGETWLDEVEPLLTQDFRLCDRYSATPSPRAIDKVEVTARGLIEIMDPMLQVRVGKNNAISGATDLSIAVWSFNERGELQCNHTAIIELNKSCAVYRAANMLTFGDMPTDDDYEALAQSIDPSNEKDKRLESTAKQLREIRKPLKHTISYENGVAVHGYTSGGVDVTKQLDKSYLRGPVEALHAGLTKVTRQGALNGCKHLAVCDGFTMIGTHLRDLEERQPGLITANFDSHYALDLTESGSALKVLQYVANTYFQFPQARHCAMIMLAAAAEELGGGDLTAEKSAALKELLPKLHLYKFDSRVYAQVDDLAESAKFASGRSPMVKDALEHFVQEFGAIAQHGEYTSANFGALQYFRENEFQGLSDGERRDAGRSRCVLKVNFFGKDGEPGSNPGYECVLKVYDGDAASVKRMERELKAYHRIAQLSTEDQQCIAKLVAFGAIDLGRADPRLFILTEYVESHPFKRPSTEERKAEIDKVHNILTSVGVYHSDLAERNMSWQEVDGKWVIKVFDFDHAKFEDVNPDANQATKD